MSRSHGGQPVSVVLAGLFPSVLATLLPVVSDGRLLYKAQICCDPDNDVSIQPFENISNCKSVVKL
jgi:hypothetical protein